MPAKKLFGEPDPSFTTLLTRKLSVIYHRIGSWPKIAKRIGVSRQMLVYCRSGLKSPGHSTLKRIDELYFKCWTQMVSRSTKNAKERALRKAEGTLGMTDLERQAELYLRRTDLTSRRQANTIATDGTNPSQEHQGPEGVNLHGVTHPETTEPGTADQSAAGQLSSGNPPQENHL